MKYFFKVPIFCYAIGYVEAANANEAFEKAKEETLLGPHICTCCSADIEFSSVNKEGEVILRPITIGEDT